MDEWKLKKNYKKLKEKREIINDIINNNDKKKENNFEKLNQLIEKLENFILKNTKKYCQNENNGKSIIIDEILECVGICIMAKKYIYLSQDEYNGNMIREYTSVILKEVIEHFKKERNFLFYIDPFLEEFIGSPKYSLFPILDRDNLKDTILLTENSFLIHQTTFENALNILKNGCIKVNQTELKYCGKYIFFGVEHRGQNEENRHGSVSFRFKIGKTDLLNFKNKYNFGTREFRNEISKVVLLTNNKYHKLIHFKNKQSIVFYNKKDLKMGDKIQWKIEKSGNQFTNPVLCLDQDLNLPNEFSMKILNHGSICAKLKENILCTDCINYDINKEYILNKLKEEIKINYNFIQNPKNEYSFKFKIINENNNNNNNIEDLSNLRSINLNSNG